MKVKVNKMTKKWSLLELFTVIFHSSLSKEAQTSLSSSSSSGRPPRHPQANCETQSLQWVMGLSRCLLPVQHAQKTSFREAFRGDLYQMTGPAQLAPLDVEEQWFFCLLSKQTPHPISKGQFSYPMEKTHFDCQSSQRLWPYR